MAEVTRNFQLIQIPLYELFFDQYEVLRAIVLVTFRTRSRCCESRLKVAEQTIN